MNKQAVEVAREGPTQWNADCPFCEVEDSLVAKIRTVYLDVQVHEDGYSLSELEPDEEVIEEVVCSECGADVGVHHYFYHGRESGEECECKAEGGM